MDETVYELWDVPSRNLLWSFLTLAEALAAVRESIAEEGAEAVIGLALIQSGASSTGSVVAADRELAALASPAPHTYAAASD